MLTVKVHSIYFYFDALLLFFSDVYPPLAPFLRVRKQSTARSSWSPYELAIVDYMLSQGVPPKVLSIRSFLSNHPTLSFTRKLPAVALKMRDQAAANK